MLPISVARLVLILIILLSVVSKAVQAEPDVKLHLQAFTDASCQGHYQLATTIPPRGCILYQLTLENRGSSAAVDLKIHTTLPAHTQFLKVDLIRNENIIYQKIGTDLYWRLDRLPTQAIPMVLKYQVQVDS